MARSDLLLSLVRAGSRGDRALFQRATEALIAEERAKQHDILADRIAAELRKAEWAGHNGHARERLMPGHAADILIELVPRRELGDMVLPELVTTVCNELVEEHHRADLLRAYNLEPRHRVLLIGPPGNGKTSLAEALAHALMVPLLVVRYEGLIGSYLGETSERLSRLFEHARSGPCVLFFDEFDTLGKERGDSHETGEIKRVVSSLLLQIDALPARVVVVTATNHPELLDRAVWRRFQVRLTLPPPARAQIAEYFTTAATRTGLDFGYAPRTLADKLHGASFAELEELVADILRRRVLSGPDADVKQVVRTRLKHWQHRASPAVE